MYNMFVILDIVKIKNDIIYVQVFSMRLHNNHLYHAMYHNS